MATTCSITISLRGKTVMDGMLSELGKQGLLGLLLAISLSMNFVLGRLLLREKDKRVEDANKYQDNLVAPVTDIGRTLERIERKTIVAKEGM